MQLRLILMSQIANGKIGKSHGEAILSEAEVLNLKWEEEEVSAQHKIGNQQEREIADIFYIPLA